MNTYSNISGTTRSEFSIKTTKIISGTGYPTGIEDPGTIWIGSGIWAREQNGWQLVSPSRIVTPCAAITTIDFDKASHHTLTVDQNTTILPVGSSCKGVLKIVNTSGYSITISANRPTDLAPYVSSNTTDILGFINFDSWLLTSYIRGYS